VAELTCHHREWVFYVELDEGQVPDQQKQYTGMWFRPSGFYFTLSASGADVPHLSRATIAGPRILKSGQPGETTVSEKYYTAGDLPEWAIVHYARAVEGIVNGLY
jgi:hypothetical protein